MTLRQKITLTIGVLFTGLMLLTAGGRPLLRIAGGLTALDGLFLHWLWYRCPDCGGRLNWTARWTYCPHCGAWIDYDKQ